MFLFTTIRNILLVFNVFVMIVSLFKYSGDKRIPLLVNTEWILNEDLPLDYHYFV